MASTECGFDGYASSCNPRLMRYLLQKCTGCLVCFDADFNITGQSDSALCALCYPQHATLSSIVSDFDNELIRDLCTKATDAGCASCHVTVCRKDGSRQQTFCSIFPIPIVDNPQFVAVFDIEQQQAQAHPLNSSAVDILDSLINEIPLPYQSLDLQGNLIAVNHAWSSVLGYTPEEVANRPFKSLLTEPSAVSFESKFADFLKLGCIKGREFDIFHKDGSVRRVSFDGRFEYSPDGKPLRSHCVFKDVTEKQLTERFIRESSTQFKLIADHASDMISHHTADGHFTYVSPYCTKMLGYQPEELIGMSMFDILFEHDRPNKAAMKKGLFCAIKSGSEIRLVRKDDTIVTAEITIQAVASPNGEPDSYIAITRDITERKEIEQRLIESSKMDSLVVLAGGLAHNFNNLLAGILGNAELALSRERMTEQLANYLNKIRNASIESSKLCAQLLAYSGQGRYVVQQVDINEIVESLRSAFEEMLPDGAILDIHKSDASVVIEADAAQIKHALKNLVENACEAVNDDGIIKIHIEKYRYDSKTPFMFSQTSKLSMGDYVLVRILDNGDGMSEEAKKHVFEPFFSTKFTGRGLGLPSCFGIARSLGGDISIESQPGKGTCVTLILPAIYKEDDLRPASTRKPTSKLDLVLIADDLDYVREMIADMLSMMGYRAVCASNGVEAVEMFRSHKNEIALVILDAIMPRMTGFDALKHIRSISSNVPVLMSSGYGEQDILEKSIVAGASGFLQKPFTLSALRDKITKLIETP